jgi:hypothetical protein
VHRKIDVVLNYILFYLTLLYRYKIIVYFFTCTDRHKKYIILCIYYTKKQQMPISPNQGPTSGDTTVTITGVNLAGALSVQFGTAHAIITANTPTSVTVSSPAGTGVADVTVTTNGGTSNSLPFYYISPPIVTSITPVVGPTAGGNTLNIYGYNLATATSVSVGSNSATPTVINDGNINIVIPAGTNAGTVSLIVTTGGGSSAALDYIYVDAPTVSSLSPSSGSTNGGTNVTISGSSLASTQSVTVGGTSASFGVLNDTTISIIVPPGTAGSADVVITTAGGSVTATGGYTYTAGPGI